MKEPFENVTILIVTEEQIKWLEKLTLGGQKWVRSLI